MTLLAPTHESSPAATEPAREEGDPPLYYRSHVFVCCNRRRDGHPRGSCAEKGSQELWTYMKARAKELGLPQTRINASLCLDRCEHGPCVVVYPEGVWYRITSHEDANAILEQHVRDGGRVRELMLPPR